MSISKSNGPITDIFKTFFEKGSDGKSGFKKEPVITTPLESTNKSFIGTLRNENGLVFIDILNGGTFNVIPKFDSPSFLELNNKRVTIIGKQVKDLITEATIIAQNKTTAPVKKLKLSTQKDLNELAKAAKSFLQKYKPQVTSLLTAKPGYKYINGEITKTMAIVAVVDKKINPASLDRTQLLPDRYLNYDIEVVEASPKDYLLYKHLPENSTITPLLEKIEPTLLESMAPDEIKMELVQITEAREIKNGYVPPSNVHLDEITEAMTLVCHVSPEGGWKTLGPFLEDTNEHLQVAMYDFSAPHLFDKMKAVLRRGASLKLVYDGNKAAGVGEGSKINDKTEETIITSFKRIAGSNFELVPAWKGNDGICSNAYHIKVAVKDKKSFWLSSGNWQTSNQPANEDFESDPSLTKDYNREWNIIVTNNNLANIYHKFIDWDFERSQEKPESALFLELATLPDFFTEADQLEDAELSRLRLFPPKKFVFTNRKPVKIQPILSPDNYIQHALKVIKSATKSLFFQNQYIKLTESITPEYEELLSALRDATNDNRIDCRIILRTPFSTADKMDMLNDLQAFDFNMSKIRLMTNTHTKGIIADGEILLIGSHNWSGSGVQFNRDASLAIYDEGVAQYYQDVFIHDWERRTGRRQREEVTVISPSGTEISSLSDEKLVRLDWNDYLD